MGAQAGSVQFTASSYSAGESSGYAIVTIARTGVNVIGTSTVDLATSPGTATAGDFSTTQMSLTSAPGDNSLRTVYIPDLVSVADKTFTVALSNPTGGLTLGTPASTTVTIVHNDSDSPGTMQLSDVTLTVGKGAGNALISVTRTGGSFGAASVMLTTSDGTGVAGTGLHGGLAGRELRRRRCQHQDRASADSEQSKGF
ncbi:MAG: Calx-beta domain-containing protein [Stenotrophobium sp.]